MKNICFVFGLVCAWMQLGCIQTSAVVSDPVAISGGRTGEKSEWRFCGWPSVCKTGPNELIAVYSGDRDEHVCPWGKVCAVRSSDGGRTWSEPETWVNGPLDDRDAGLIRLANGDLVLFWFTSIHYYENTGYQTRSKAHEECYRRHFEKLPDIDGLIARELGAFSMRSTDGGKTWEPKVRMPTSAPHGAIQLKDGRLIAVGTQNAAIRGRRKDAPDEKALEGSHEINVVAESVDFGKSWHELARIPNEWGECEICEPHLIEGADGVLRCYFRDVKLWYTESRDGGKTWTKLVKTGIDAGWSPPFLSRAADGRTLLTYARRDWNNTGKTTGVFAAFGDKDAKPESFSNEREVAVFLTPNSDMGYASTAQLDDGTFVTVYYCHEGGDGLVPAHIQATRWREGDAAEPRLSHRPGVEGAYDVWVRWNFTGGNEDARIEIAHAGGVTGYSFDQRRSPGWHFAGSYVLRRDSEILATNRGAYGQPHLATPRGFDEVRVTPTVPRTVVRKASELVSVCELNLGDTLEFTLADGRVRRITLVGTSARVLERHGDDVRKYAFAVELVIDGKTHTLERTVPSVEFLNGEPFTIDGVDIWPDAVQDLFRENGGFFLEKDFRFVAAACRPMRRARIVLQDATRRIVPERMRMWWPVKAWPLDPRDCYNGRDCWMGPWYQCAGSPRGTEAHCGVDVNMSAHTPLTVPFDLDDQHYFHAVKAGDNNNRWRGVRHWNTNEWWWIQAHHIDTPYLVPEHTPLAAGCVYALSGGEWSGDFPHTHFNVRVFTRRPGPDGCDEIESYWINPAVLFRQMRLDNPSSDPEVPFCALPEKNVVTSVTLPRIGAWECGYLAL